jgi:hypothetical protein
MYDYSTRTEYQVPGGRLGYETEGSLPVPPVAYACVGSVIVDWHQIQKIVSGANVITFDYVIPKPLKLQHC